MSQNPINLGVRFLLEMIALLAIGAGAASLAEGFGGVLLGIGAAVIAAALWGTFNVPEDGSRADHVVVRVPGVVRLLLELAIFAAATVATGNPTWALVMGGVVVVHYLLSYDRVLWLLGS